MARSFRMILILRIIDMKNRLKDLTVEAIIDTG